MSKGRKIALVILVLIVALAVAIVVVVPRLVDLDRYRPEIVATLQQRTGRPVEISRLQLRLFPSLAVRASHVALGNPAGFPQDHFIEMARVDAEVDARALWHRQLVIRSVKLDRPVIHLMSTPDGRWNFENPLPGQIKRTAYRPDTSSFSLGVISRVTIAAGDVTAARLLPSSHPDAPFFEMRGVSAELDQVDLASFGLSASMPSDGRPAILKISDVTSEPSARIAAIADSSYRASKDGLAISSLRFDIPEAFAVSNLRSEVPEAFGISNLRSEIPEELSQAGSTPPPTQGNIEAKSLRFGSLEATHLKSKVTLYRKQAVLNGLTFDFYEGRGQGDVSLDFGGPNLRYGTKIKLSDVDMARLLAAFPGARGKLTGKMTGNLSLEGENTKSSDPLAGKQGHGELTIRDGKLPTLDLNKNLLRLDNLIRGGSYGDPSSFSSLSADLEIAGGRISSRNITIIGGAVNVDAHGSLTLAGVGSLNYEGVAKIAARENQLTALLGGLLGSKVTGGKLSFPFGLQGTLEHPRFLMKSGPFSSPTPRVIP